MDRVDFMTGKTTRDDLSAVAEDGAEPRSSIPMWGWAIIAIIGFKAVKHLFAVLSTTLSTQPYTASTLPYAAPTMRELSQPLQSQPFDGRWPEVTAPVRPPVVGSPFQSTQPLQQAPQ